MAALNEGPQDVASLRKLVNDLQLQINALVAGGSGLQVARVDLSSADLNALFSNPPVIITGQAGKLIVPVAGAIKYNFNSVAFTTSHPYLALGAANYFSGSGSFDLGSPASGSSAIFGDVLNNTKNDAASGSICSQAAGNAVSPIGQPLILTDGADSSTTGDSTATIWVYYVVQDVS